MSSTETIVEPTTVRETLRAYDIHHTGSDETLEPPTEQTQNQPQEGPVSQPGSNWPSDWRRIPPYRPSSRSHRVSDRPAGLDRVEGTMVIVMFTGVWTYGNLNRLWRATVGKWNNSIMRYKIGGEW
ncbi:uncharacterized protein A1O5_02555 [Cladophialophora psammophila CBS 110553]|uniref:Uncharacterized protein n=1 Tax=Cladophialophora psammophila CBS 110553 TaxID=1182543 RepID=W9XVH3_9EURO|nr:uncharacterized protein A1O5_02555 [Cladophialophora psammophila CBS 110553]EXJ74259.1 hypothetical protein A1O5_02555 [Cladophialophora psammophila CBS 110553]